MIGGNGFIAAFFVGFTFAVRTESVREETQEFSESEGMILSLLTFLILGLVMIPSTVEHWTLNTTLYALLSLTLVRIIPVAIGLIGTKLDWQTLLFVGWFGPRGIASILYLLMLVSNIGTEGYETVLSTGVQAILFSVVLHGATASPVAKRYGALEAQRSS
jgi:NhaP-type Na+/H+ or K+/H+ antiporter